MTNPIGFLVFENFQILDASGPITVFEIANHLGEAGYDLSFGSIGGGMVKSSSGLIVETIDFTRSQRFDTIIVAGGDGVDKAMECNRTQKFLRDIVSTSRRVCSVCSGSLLLAAAGLLDGRRATTHWSRTAQFSRLFPPVKLEIDEIYVRDENLWTSAGITAGIDLALALVAEDQGRDVATDVSRHMVVYFHRPGGQSQFSALGELAGGDDKFASLLEWARTNLANKLTVDMLAERVSMSPRNFSRSFQRAVGKSPAKAVEQLRVEVAREKVEHSDLPIELIATETGFNDPERMRRAFIRVFGQPPQSIRRSSRWFES